MVLFVSQPLKGKKEEEILAVQEKALTSAKAKFGDDVDIFKPIYEMILYDIDDVCSERERLSWLAKTIASASCADIFYFAKGWEKVRECRIEHQCALEYGYTIIED